MRKVNDGNIHVLPASDSEGGPRSRRDMQRVVVDAFEKGDECGADVAVLFHQQNMSATLWHRVEGRTSVSAETNEGSGYSHG